MKVADLAYIAGLIDGEGYIGVRRIKARQEGRNSGYLVTVQIGMIDRPAIDFVQSLFGGDIQKEIRLHGRPLYRLRLERQRAEDLIKAILPYLKVKTKIAKHVLRFRLLQAKSKQYRISRGKGLHGSKYSQEFINLCETGYTMSKLINQGQL